jgi:hypothetical protein
MRHAEVSTAEHLDAKLALRSMRKHAELWKVAEGTMGWRGVVTLLPPVVLIAIGVAQLIQEKGLAELVREAGGAVYVLLGLVLLGSFLWSSTQRQLNAVLELMKRLENDRS